MVFSISSLLSCSFNLLSPPAAAADLLNEDISPGGRREEPRGAFGLALIKQTSCQPPVRAPHDEDDDAPTVCLLQTFINGCEEAATVSSALWRCFPANIEAQLKLSWSKMSLFFKKFSLLVYFSYKPNGGQRSRNELKEQQKQKQGKRRSLMKLSEPQRQGCRSESNRWKWSYFKIAGA